MESPPLRMAARRSLLLSQPTFPQGYPASVDRLTRPSLGYKVSVTTDPIAFPPPPLTEGTPVTPGGVTGTGERPKSLELMLVPSISSRPD